MARTIHVGFNVNQEEKEMLEELTEKEDRTAAHIMRRALNEYYKNHK